MLKRVSIFIIFLILSVTIAYALEDRSTVAIVKIGNNVFSDVSKGLKMAGDLSSKIKKNDRVIIKISIDKPREDNAGYASNIDVVRQLVRICKQKGARRVMIVEGVLSGDSYKAFDLAGYTKMAKEENAVLKSLDSGQFWRSWVPDGSSYKKYANNMEILNCEVLINVPVLRYDQTSSVSISLKSMIGTIYGKNVKKNLLKDPKLDEAIVDLNMIRPVDFTIVDGTSVIMPDGKTKKDLGIIIVSADPVAADAVGAEILGFGSKTIRHLEIAASKGLGNNDMANIKVTGENIERLERRLKD